MNLAGKKVYFPVESLVGLGHFNRAGRIVREMAGAGLDVTVASGTFVDPGRFFPGARIRKLPPYIHERKTGAFSLNADGSRTLVPHFNRRAWEGCRIRAQRDAVSDCNPDIVISEFWPFDRPDLDNEMGALLQPRSHGLFSLFKKPAHAMRLVSVRDVLDVPDSKISGNEGRFGRDQWAARAVNSHFDAVLVHGDPDFIPLSDTFSATDAIKKDIIYTGYVVDALPRDRPQDHDNSIIVSCGSGVDAHDMIYDFLAAWGTLINRRARDAMAARVVDRPLKIVCGPRFAPHAFRNVNEWVRALNTRPDYPITVTGYLDSFKEALGNAAFSVSLAGYNTTLETLAMNKPSLLIPKYTVVDGKANFSSEQLYRLVRLRRKGYATYAHPETVQNTDLFADFLVMKFAEQMSASRPKPTLNFNGAADTVKAISDLYRRWKPADEKSFFSFFNASRPVAPVIPVEPPPASYVKPRHYRFTQS